MQLVGRGGARHAAPSPPTLHGGRRIDGCCASPLPKLVVGARAAPEPQQQQQEGASTDAPPQPSLLDPAATISWGGRQPSRRRAAIGLSVASAVALGGNLGGVTSWLLGLDGGQLAASARLDQIVPVLGMKRCYDSAYGFEFLYPASWLADQTLYYRAAQRAEASRSLDPPALRRGPRQREVVEPLAAFGPAGSSGEENVSVIVAPIYEGFRLESLGTPEAAAQQFLSTIAAPPGSDRQATLLAAQERRDAAGTQYFEFEFQIQSPRFARHNVAALATQDNLLYTLTAQCPQSRWAADGERLRQAVASLSLRRARVMPGTL